MRDFSSASNASTLSLDKQAGDLPPGLLALAIAKASAQVPGMTDPFLIMTGISKSYPGIRALDAVDFSVSAGEVVGLVGENGAGKSTLMKILGGVREGTIEGTVVQNPYEWGHQGMTLMAKYLKGDKSGVPADGLIIVPGQVITKGNVDAFEAELKSRIGG